MKIRKFLSNNHRNMVMIGNEKHIKKMINIVLGTDVKTMKNKRKLEQLAMERALTQRFGNILAHNIVMQIKKKYKEDPNLDANYVMDKLLSMQVGDLYGFNIEAIYDPEREDKFLQPIAIPDMNNLLSRYNPIYISNEYNFIFRNMIHDMDICIYKNDYVLLIDCDAGIDEKLKEIIEDKFSSITVLHSSYDGFEVAVGDDMSMKELNNILNTNCTISPIIDFETQQIKTNIFRKKLIDNKREKNNAKSAVCKFTEHTIDISEKTIDNSMKITLRIKDKDEDKIELLD